MVSTGLRNGPYSRDEIDKHVKKGRSIGAYVLGRINPKTGGFRVRYVGRSDDNDKGLRGRLHSHDGTKPECTHFKFGYLDTQRAAYEKECRIYHDFNEPPLNKNHPDVPDGVTYGCPVKGCEYSQA